MAALPTASRLWIPDEVAEYLGVPVKTLYEWRTNKKGPKGLKIGRHLRFAPEDVVTWAKAQTDDADGTPQ